MSGGAFESAWFDPRELIEARPLFAGLLEPGVAQRFPRAGLSVLVTLSGHEALWSIHAVSVGLWRSTGRESTYWLSEAARASTEVFSYLERFGLPVAGAQFAANVVAEAFEPGRLDAAAQILGGTHAICSQACTFGGTLDRECYYSCILEG
ncbi:hypothetical protein ACXC9Q_02775 [Kribbella sp. CWNU-51]